MDATYFIQFNGSVYAGRGVTPDGTLPEGAIPCTEDQFNQAGSWTTLNGDQIVIGEPPQSE